MENHSDKLYVTWNLLLDKNEFEISEEIIKNLRSYIPTDIDYAEYDEDGEDLGIHMIVFKKDSQEINLTRMDSLGKDFNAFTWEANEGETLISLEEYLYDQSITEIDSIIELLNEFISSI